MKLKFSIAALALVAAGAAAAVLSLPTAAVRGPHRRPVPTIWTADHPRPIVSWRNAPSPDPGFLDGVYMIYNPLKPSDGPYPVLRKGEKIWIDVSITQQLVYIFHGDRRIYTMATSSGMQSVKGDGSPPGIYHIQAERGTWFYLPNEHVGAKYWVSWRGNGVYLFHSIPMTRNKKIMPWVAARLLHEASFGCFLLTVSDARWIYNHVPYGTTVIVERGPVLLKAGKIFDPTESQTLAADLSKGSGTD